MKEALRREILWQRSALSEEQWQMDSQKIKEALCATAWYQSARTLFIFISMHQEVDTCGIIRQAWQDGKRTAVPVAKKGGQMYFVPITDFSALKKSSFGVMEPQNPPEDAVLAEAGDLFVIPGAVFDQKGNRYGYGGGYYDRYFAAHPHGRRAAVAFSFQVTEELPEIAAHDVPMDLIITERETIVRVQEE